MPDTSLDDFIGGEGSAGEDETGEDAAADVDSAASEGEGVGEEAVGGAESAGDDGEPTVEPAVSTYDFSPEGAPCAACGASVEKRWRAEAGLVCPGCKEW